MDLLMSIKKDQLRYSFFLWIQTFQTWEKQDRTMWDIYFLQELHWYDWVILSEWIGKTVKIFLSGKIHENFQSKLIVMFQSFPFAFILNLLILLKARSPAPVIQASTTSRTWPAVRTSMSKPVSDSSYPFQTSYLSPISLILLVEKKLSCGEISAFHVWQLWENWIFLHMWRNFRCLHIRNSPQMTCVWCRKCRYICKNFPSFFKKKLFLKIYFATITRFHVKENWAQKYILEKKWQIWGLILLIENFTFLKL